MRLYLQLSQLENSRRQRQQAAEWIDRGLEKRPENGLLWQTKAAFQVRQSDVAGLEKTIERLEELGASELTVDLLKADKLLAERKPHWAVRDDRGGLWIDGLGDPWVDAYNDSVWIYAAELAAEAVLMGFREIQFDYLRFPDERGERMRHAVFGARQNKESRRSAIRRQVTLLRDRVKPLGVPFTLDVFGLSMTATNDMGIGQYWDDLSPLADVLLPMVYPSHYPRGSYGISFPNADPYETIRRALQDGIRRSESIPNAAKIRPYLQAFSIRGVRYTSDLLRAQIQAAEDLGITDWIFWNARGVYPADAFRPAAPDLNAPAATISTHTASPTHLAVRRKRLRRGFMAFVPWRRTRGRCRRRCR